MMVIAMVTVWGGLIAAIMHLRSTATRSDHRRKAVISH